MAVAPTSAWRTSFHKEVVKHYLDLFVDAVALVVDHCLHSIWELFAKAFEIMVVVDGLHDALQAGRHNKGVAVPILGRPYEATM